MTSLRIEAGLSTLETSIEMVGAQFYTCSDPDLSQQTNRA